jgi:hydrogenase nickel incorporation protein HypA/HybF
MHELSITQSLIEIVNEEAAKHAISRVKTIKLKVGMLRAIEPGSLMFCFEIVSRDTPAEGAKLVIDFVPAQARCLECGELFEERGLACVCPHCRGHRIETINGREFYVEEIQGD